MFHLPLNPNSFQSFDHVGAGRWHSFVKPLGAKLYTFVLIGAGGGGGAGFTRAAGAAGGGGGGGGSGAVSTLMIPADFVPDEIFIQPGLGGNPGVAGGFTYVSLVPTIGVPTATQLALEARGGGTGGPGSATAVGAAGAAGVATLPAGTLLSKFGSYISTVGQVGVAGGAVAGAVGVSVTPTGMPVTGGAGGAGTTSGSFVGGAIQAVVGINPNVPGGNAGIDPNGADGFSNSNPFFFTGGSGGAASSAIVGGKGGNGAIGSGGGGGGAGTTGGVGGMGGHGVVFLSILF